MTTFTGTIPTFTAGDTTTVTGNLNTLRDALKGATEAWTAYSPTYTNLTIGNATVVYRYLRLNKWLLLRIDIVGGSTTSASGAIGISIPASTHASGLQAVTLRHYNGTSVVMGGSYVSAGTSTITVATTAGNVSTFSSGHQMTFTADLELA